VRYRALPAPLPVAVSPLSFTARFYPAWRQPVAIGICDFFFVAHAAFPPRACDKTDGMYRSETEPASTGDFQAPK